MVFTAVVTGAGSGIGFETCRQLLSEGWRVFALGLSTAALTAVSEESGERLAIRPAADAFNSADRPHFALSGFQRVGARAVLCSHRSTASAPRRPFTRCPNRFGLLSQGTA